MESQFLFNTSSLFMIGSPLGVFLHLNQAQLIARKVIDFALREPAIQGILSAETGPGKNDAFSRR